MWTSPTTLTIALRLFYFSTSGRTADISAFPQPIIPDGVSTCPSQTINYITHSLPQQCLRTGWSSETTIAKELADRPPIDGFQQPTAVLSTSPSTIATLEDADAEIGSARDPAARSSRGMEGTISTTVEASTTPPENQATTLVSEEAETDVLSDAPSFLSFEEWKAQMLAKAGQSPEDVRGMPSNAQGHDMRRRPGSVNNVLDSLGDDAEIELDFSGFVNEDTASSVLPRKPYASPDQNPVTDDHDGAETSRKISTEAGTTSKERFNYASFDCAATILKQNPECKGFNAVLSENKDTYMLNLCSARNKFFIVELCNDILIDTLVLANFEFFSSTFRTFRVSISDRYPVKLDKWRDIGTFEARNARGLQVFLVENGLIWARYLRIEFLTHFGSEYYCPVSLLRVHGKTMMDDWRNDVKAAKGEDDLDDAEDVPATGALPVAIEMLLPTESPTHTASSPAMGTSEAGTPTADPSGPGATDLPSSASLGSIPSATTHTCGSPLLEQYKRITGTCSSDIKQCPVDTATEAVLARESSAASSATAANPSTSSASSPPPSVISKPDQNATVSELQGTTASTEHAAPTGPSSSEEKSDMTSATSTSATTRSTAQHNTIGPSKTIQQPTPPTPSTQESFFKSVHKRLQHLEANSTLSLQYIEEQSRILREAFAKGQKQQLGKTTAFLESLNVTVLGELQTFRSQYDQIWQSTVLELSAQREQSQREIVALTARLGILADEILFQKRMVILQFALIVLCLGLVLFSRSPIAAVLDLPSTVQSMVAKPSKGARYLHVDSPSRSPSRPPSRYGWLSSGASPFLGLSSESTMYDESTDKAEAAYAPPTPQSESSATDGDDRSVSTESPEPKVAMRRAHSTPSSLALLPETTAANGLQQTTAEQASPTGDARSTLRVSDSGHLLGW